jgi:hypothetical protein
MIPAILSASGSGSNKPVRVQVILNGTLTDPLWTTYAADHALASVDTSATAISGGDLIFASSFSGVGGSVIQSLFDLDIDLRPEDIISIVITPTGTAADIVASLCWLEDV